MKNNVTIYSDGACRGNPGPGGYGYIICTADGKSIEGKGFCAQTTNNRMEMLAAITALQHDTIPHKVTIVTDSQYLVKGMTEWITGWQARGWCTANRKPVKNKDLWLALVKLSTTHQMSWEWVKGHAGHPENERCDQLANMAIDECLTPVIK